MLEGTRRGGRVKRRPNWGPLNPYLPNLLVLVGGGNKADREAVACCGAVIILNGYWYWYSIKFHMEMFVLLDLPKLLAETTEAAIWKNCGRSKNRDSNHGCRSSHSGDSLLKRKRVFCVCLALSPASKPADRLLARMHAAATTCNKPPFVFVLHHV